MSDDAPPPVSAVLMAAAKHVAVMCAAPSAAFVACKKGDKNPAACLAAGDAVTACVAGLLKRATEAAPEELAKYVDCLEYNRCEAGGKKGVERFAREIDGGAAAARSTLARLARGFAVLDQAQTRA
jgi:hypothetical protein